MPDGSDGSVAPPGDGQPPPPDGAPPSAVGLADPDAPVGELGIPVSLDQFNGPMDLLLYLVRRTEVDVRDLPISSIADQFAAWVSSAVDLDLEQAGDFVVMAATLLEIKARLVAPPPAGTEVADDGEDDYDPRAGLIRKLLAYRAAKEAAFDLDRRDAERRYRHERGHREVVPDDPGEVDAWELKDVDAGALATLWFDLLKRIDGLGPRTVIVDDVPMGERMAQVTETMRQRGEGRISELFAVETGKIGRVGVVMAVLECTRQRFITVRQGEQYGDVLMRFRAEDDRAIQAGDPGPPDQLPKRQRRPPLVTWTQPDGAAAEVADAEPGDEAPVENEEQRFLRELEQGIGVERLLSRSADLEAGFIAWWEETHPGEPLPPGVVKPEPPPPPPVEPAKPVVAIAEGAVPAKPKRFPPRRPAATPTPAADGQAATPEAPVVPDPSAQPLDASPLPLAGAPSTIPDPSPWPLDAAPSPQAAMEVRAPDPTAIMPLAAPDPDAVLPAPAVVPVAEEPPAAAVAPAPVAEEPVQIEPAAAPVVEMQAATAADAIADVPPAIHPSPQVAPVPSEAEPAATGAPPAVEASGDGPVPAADAIVTDHAPAEPDTAPLPAPAAAESALDAGSGPRVPDLAEAPASADHADPNDSAEPAPVVEASEPVAANRADEAPADAVPAPPDLRDPEPCFVVEPLPAAVSPEVPPPMVAAVPGPASADAEPAAADAAPVEPPAMAEPAAGIAPAAEFAPADVTATTTPDPDLSVTAAPAAVAVQPTAATEPVAAVADAAPGDSTPPMDDTAADVRAPAVDTGPVVGPSVLVAVPAPDVPPPVAATPPPDPDPPPVTPPPLPRSSPNPAPATTPTSPSQTPAPMSRPRNLRYAALVALNVLAFVVFVAWLQRPGAVLALAGGPDDQIVARDGELRWTLNLPVAETAKAPVPVIEPAVPGVFAWHDARTVVFTPQGGLPAGASLNVRFPKDLRAAGSFRFPDDAVPVRTIRTLPALVVQSAAAAAPAFGDATVVLALNRVPADPQAAIGSLSVVPAVQVTAVIEGQALRLTGAFAPGTTYRIALVPASGRADDRPEAWQADVAIPARVPGARLAAGVGSAPVVEAVGIDLLVAETGSGDAIRRAILRPQPGADGIARTDLPGWLLSAGANTVRLRWSGGSAEASCIRHDLRLDPADAAPVLTGGAIPVVSVR